MFSIIPNFKKINRSKIYREKLETIENVDKRTGEVTIEYKKTQEARLDENGHEIPDPTPMVVYTDLNRPLTMEERIARIMRSNQLQEAAEREGYETFDDADDFSVLDDDTDDSWDSPHEIDFDPIANREFTPHELTNRDIADHHKQKTIQNVRENEQILSEEAQKINRKARKHPFFKKGEKPTGNDSSAPGASQTAKGEGE